MLEVDQVVRRTEVERDYEYSKWNRDIPFLQFDKDWQVKVIPPFGGAVARFCVKYEKAWVSVYLDCYDSLGYVGVPYWEIYPYDDDDTFRCGINETDELINAIRESINEQNKE